MRTLYILPVRFPPDKGLHRKTNQEILAEWEFITEKVKALPVDFTDMTVFSEGMLLGDTGLGMAGLARSVKRNDNPLSKLLKFLLDSGARLFGLDDPTANEKDREFPAMTIINNLPDNGTGLLIVRAKNFREKRSGVELLFAMNGIEIRKIT